MCGLQRRGRGGGVVVLQRKIDYLEIASVIEGAMRAYTNTEADTLDAVLGADRWAREFVYSKV